MVESILVLSHLRWNFVFQRPQHLLTRLAKHYRVYFVEEPVYSPGVAGMPVTQDASGVVVCQPHTPVKAPGFHDDQIPQVRQLINELMSGEPRAYAVWFYTPMALPLIQGLAPKLIVYDCMDELSAFLNAPKQLLQREHALLQQADLVFTGGPSLYRAKAKRHPAVHCFPSSVDHQHFGRAADGEGQASEQAGLPAPRLGFFGVIDERIDLDLLAALADARADWQIVMVGPVVKISPASLPVRPNIHYLGQRSYDELPEFLRGWDVCLLPFARNAATEFISPTKTLEYMAAGKPIVSTPITDVVEPHGDLVAIAATPAEFINACTAALRETASERQRRQEAMRVRLSTTSWDTTAGQMHELLGAAPMVQKPQTRKEPARDAGVAYPDVIIGAGPTGLSAAYHLGKSALMVEAAPNVGGWCRSIQEGGYTFDHAGHIMFSKDPYVLELYRTLLGDNVHWQDREAWIHNDGVDTRYPFQGALHGLPPQVLKECLIGAIEAHYGPLPSKVREQKPATGSSVCDGKAESITDCCADGTMEVNARTTSSAAGRPQPRGVPRNFEEFIYSVWGAGVARHFAIPYNRKLWAVPLTEMETSWLGGRVPMPDLEEMIDGALRPVAKPVGPNARFGYPLRGGFQALMDAFVPHLQGELRLGTKVVGVVPSEHEVALSDGTTCHYDHLISTMPLPQLIAMIGDEAPVAVREAADQLRHVSVRCVNLGVARPNITDKHWIYYPGPTVFHRIFVQGNASPHCNPEGGFGLTCEITYAPGKPLPCDGDELIDLCITDCIRVGMLRPDDKIAVRNQVDMPYAYVVYDHARKRNVDLIRAWLGPHSIILAGRYSQWEYYNSDHAFIAGKQAAEEIQARRATPLWATPSEEIVSRTVELVS